ncbi:DUF6468 domain-containing protein [Pedomonas sp. V897]|uniref:DUF6468 domain-containing protein n=1 Tax=Pedomonas sp. V897 TaxID=3446482 RepID=UPI003EE379D2
MLGWIMDVVLCLMLLAALTGGFILNRRLAALREERVHMETMIRTLTATVAQAENSVHALKAAAQEVESSLRERVTKGRALADELVIITQAGEDLARRLEEGLSGAAAAVRPKAEVTPLGTPAGAAAKAQPRLRALDGLR